MDFKERFKELRLAKGWSQAEAGKHLGLSQSTVGAYETGDRSPTFEGLEKIADFFNVSMDYLMGNDDKSMYYLDPEVAELAQRAYDDPDTRLLLSAKDDISKEDFEYIMGLIKRFRNDDV